MADGPDAIKLYVTNDLPGQGNLMLRMSPEIAEEVRTLLDEHELEHSMAFEFSADTQLALETVAVLAASFKVIGGLNGLAEVIRTIAHRHDGKTIELTKDGSMKISGFGDLDKVDEFLEKQAEKQAEIEAAREKEIEGP